MWKGNLNPVQTDRTGGMIMDMTAAMIEGTTADMIAGATTAAPEGKLR